MRKPKAPKNPGRGGYDDDYGDYEGGRKNRKSEPKKAQKTGKSEKAPERRAASRPAARGEELFDEEEEEIQIPHRRPEAAETCRPAAKRREAVRTENVPERTDTPERPVRKNVADMEKELGTGNKKPEILSRLAQYELTLTDWVESHKGSRKYVAVAGKCWPAFQTQFGCVPCYVNSRLTSRGIPVSCEVDIYGALSEFIGEVVSDDIVTLLDINNTVPADIYNEDIAGRYAYTQKDTFMGFHCGNTASSKLSFCEMRNQMIMARSLPEEVTNGTLEGDIVPGDITFFRLQNSSDNKLSAYIAQGEVLPVRTRSFGAIGIFAIPEMGRFYRHVLIEGNFPHHGAVAFGHFGKTLFDVFKYIGVEDVSFNQPKGMLYKSENPFA